MEKAYVSLGNYFCSDCTDRQFTRLRWCRRLIKGLCDYFTGDRGDFSDYRFPISRQSITSPYMENRN